MFGIGRAVKKANRRLKNKFQDYKADKYSRNYFRNFEELGYDLEYFVDVVPEYKIVYFHVPKVASTSLKTTLSTAIGYGGGTIHHRKDSKLKSPRQFGLKNFVQLVNDPDSLVFTVVRHPLDRIISCYKDKYQPFKFSDKRFDGNREYLTEEELSSIENGNSIPFDLFVRMASRSCYTGQDGHYLAMSRLIPLKMLPFNHVGKLENLSQTFDLLRKQGVPDKAIVYKSMGKTSGIGRKIPVDTESAHLINASYMCDFKNFGYDFIPTEKWT